MSCSWVRRCGVVDVRGACIAAEFSLNPVFELRLCVDMPRKFRCYNLIEQSVRTCVLVPAIVFGAAVFSRDIYMLFAKLPLPTKVCDWKSGREENRWAT